MSPSPTHLAAGAVALRAVATALVADFGDLAPHSGRATWEGPAATAHRRRAAAATGDAGAVADELRRLADRLDARAAAVRAADDAAAERRHDRLTAPGADRPGEVRAHG